MPPLPWSDLGAGALLAMVIVMILVGWLVPRRSVADKNAEIAELRRAAAARDEANRELRQQNGALIDAARTSTAIAESVQRYLGREVDS